MICNTPHKSINLSLLLSPDNQDFMIAKIVNEITFYLSNQAGALAKVTRAIAEADISIQGLLVSEGFGKSVVRVVVQPEKENKALEVLAGMGIDDVTKTAVLEILLPSRVGILAELSEKLGASNINMENIYVTESTAGDTICYVSVKDVDEALELFQE